MNPVRGENIPNLEGSEIKKTKNADKTEKKGKLKPEDKTAAKQGEKIIKSKEAEDIKSKPIRARRASAPNLGRSTLQLVPKKPGDASILDAQMKADEAKAQLEISKRSGEIWKCTKRMPDKLKGYIYFFDLNAKFNDVTVHEERKERLNAAIKEQLSKFPAVEELGSDVLFLDPKVDKATLIDLKSKQIFNKYVHRMTGGDPSKVASNLALLIHLGQTLETMKLQTASEIQGLIVVAPVLRELGFECTSDPEGVHLKLPDPEAFQARWEKLREKRPNLPKFDIVSAEGIADYKSFIQAFMTHDALVSSEEFVHDMLVHVLPTAIMMINAGDFRPEYYMARHHLVILVAQLYKGVAVSQKAVEENKLNMSQNELLALKNNCDKVEAVIGACVDIFSTLDDSHEGKYLYTKDNKQNFWGLFEDPMWKKYFQDQFGQNVNEQTFLDAWNEITAVEMKMNDLR